MNKLIQSLIDNLNNSLYRLIGLSNLYTVIFVLIYFFIIAFACNFNLYKIIALFISFLFSFAISNFLLDNYQFSDNEYIRYTQKFILIIIITTLGCVTLFYIGINSSAPANIASSLLFFGNSKIPNWLKSFIYAGLSLYIINLIRGKNEEDIVTSILLSNLLIIKFVLIIASIFSLILIFYHI